MLKVGDRTENHELGMAKGRQVGMTEGHQLGMITSLGGRVLTLSQLLHNLLERLQRPPQVIRYGSDQYLGLAEMFVHDLAGGCDGCAGWAESFPLGSRPTLSWTIQT